MTILVFDLDDTLYDELTFVQSGFHAVADEVSKQFDLSKTEIFTWMWQRLKTHGRGKIFDDLLRMYNIYSTKSAKKCIHIYRNHSPSIQLFDHADDCLNRFKDYPIYIVTDGNKIVQYNKLVALGLYQRVKGCYITHRHGIVHAKPSPYCFQRIALCEHAQPNQIIYLADNPHKDFVGIKPLGFKTIRIMQGQYKDIEKEDEFEAHLRINSLSELNKSLLTQLVHLS